MRITMEKLENLKREAAACGFIDNTNPSHRLGMRNLIWASFDEKDYIETKDAPVTRLALGLALFCYDRQGKGYNGIKAEIKERKDNLSRLTVKNWFKHKLGDADFTYNKRKAEKKTGCGNWLSCEINDIEYCRRQYEKTGDYIVWDYDHKPMEGKKNDNELHIHIACTWKQFFKYLDTYEKGWKTFFKYNAIKSTEAGTNIWEMNTLKSSKRKIDFLENFHL